MSTPRPKMKRSKRVPAAEQYDEMVDLTQDSSGEDEAGPSHRPAKAQRVRRGQSQPMAQHTQHVSQVPRSQAFPSTPQRSMPPSQVVPPPSAEVRRQHAKLDKEEEAQLKAKVLKYKEAAEKVAAEANFTLSNVEFNSLVGRIVRYMLFAAHEKPGTPVLRSKLSELVLADNKTHKHAKKLLSRVLPEAQARLLAVFGIEMREVERISERRARAGGEEAAAAATGTGVSCYVLRNALPGGLRELVLQHRVGGGAGVGAERGLTMVVLTVLHMDGGKMEESVLWRWLSQLGIHRDGPDAEHPVFGKVADKLAQLVSTRWLLCTKGTARAEGGFEMVYEWGEAARDEISEQNIKDFIDREFKQFEQTQHRSSEVIEISD